MDSLHWVVTLNRRNRMVFFAALLPVLGSHLLHMDAGALPWTLLVLQLLVYPQLVFLHARLSKDPLRAEMRNLLLDGVLLGAWAAAWGLPLWIAFMLFIAVCLNVVIFMGMPGLWKGMSAFVGGTVAVTVLDGLQLRPETSLTTSLLCIAILTLYLVFFAHDAYVRGVSLRDSRRQLGERLDEITALQAKLQEQAVRDPLTALYNRRYMDQALAHELAAASVSGEPLALLLIDIDRFKRINDSFGHPAGDEMIRRLAELLAARAKGSGVVVCRYGGEEFLIMLPGTGIATAHVLAERLRVEFESMRVELDGIVMQTTLSIGVSGYPTHAADPQTLVREADRALYEAKLRGRNRVVLSSDASGMQSL